MQLKWEKMQLVFFFSFLQKESLSPKVTNIFVQHFRNMPLAEIERSERFQNHVRMFMSTIASVTESLERDDGAASDMLLMLGAKHATFKGFNCLYFV